MKLKCYFKFLVKLMDENYESMLQNTYRLNNMKPTINECQQ